MTKEPWDLPLEEASREPILDLLEQYRNAGQIRELGITCTQAARLFKEIGPMDEAAEYGKRAILYLRQTDDKKELIRALRAACVPFTAGPHHEYLAEALELSREIGDREQEGWTIYRLTRAMPTPGISMETVMTTLEHGSEEDSLKLLDEVKGTATKTYSIEDALVIFEEIGNPVGIATCLVSLGVERKPSDRALFDRAISLYEEADETEAARKARMMADVFAPKND